MENGTIFTVLCNGTLLKPQEYRDDEIIDATQSKSTFGMLRKKHPESAFRESDWTAKLAKVNSKKTILDADGKEIDIGTFVVKSSSSGVYQLYGLSKDVSKLPTTLAMGSSAYCVDTGDLYMFDSENKQWTLQ